MRFPGVTRYCGHPMDSVHGASIALTGHAGLFFERSAWVVGGHARDKLFSQDIPDCGERYRPLRPGIGSLLESGDRQVEFRFC
jgi:hypothetical protein